MQTYKFEGKRETKNGPIIQVEEKHKVYSVIFKVASELDYGPYQCTPFDLAKYAPQIEKPNIPKWEDIHAVKAGIWQTVDYHSEEPIPVQPIEKPVKKRSALFV